MRWNDNYYFQMSTPPWVSPGLTSDWSVLRTRDRGVRAALPSLAQMPRMGACAGCCSGTAAKHLNPSISVPALRAQASWRCPQGCCQLPVSTPPLNTESQSLGRSIRRLGSARRRKGSGILKAEERTTTFFFPFIFLSLSHIKCFFLKARNWWLLNNSV